MKRTVSLIAILAIALTATFVLASCKQAHEHEYSQKVTEPTCEAGGYTTYTCSGCGDEYVDNETDPISHSYTDEVIEPTCEVGGHTLYTCSGCGDEYVDNETDPLDHDYEAEVVEPGCENGGYTRYTCSRCNSEYTDNETDPIDHNYESEVIEATCEVGGYTLYTCTKCDDSYTGNYNSSLGHDFGAWYTYKEATCTEYGEERSDCTRCDSYYSQVIYTHDTMVDVFEPTCEEGGYTRTYCFDCQKEIISDQTDALGHNYVDYVCDRCGRLFDDGNGIVYALSNDGSYYIITGLEEGVDIDDVELISVYRGKPVKEIGAYAFAWQNMTGITIPDSITSIGEYAFMWCDNLERITIPASVQTIDKHAFLSCWALSSVEFEEGSALKTINQGAFSCCLSLVEIVLPDGLKTIGDEVFDTCRCLALITIPESVTSVARNAFDDCNVLVEVKNYSAINFSLSHTINYAKYIYSADEADDVDSEWWIEEGFLFYQNGDYFCLVTQVEQTPDDPILVLPELNGREYAVYTRAFSGFNHLTNFVIPNNVTEIGTRAFTTTGSEIEYNKYDNGLYLGNATNPYFALVDLEHEFKASLIIHEDTKVIEDSACFESAKLLEVYNLSDLELTVGSEGHGYAAYYAKVVHTSTDIPSRVWETTDGFVFYEDGDTCYLVGYNGAANAFTLPESCNGKSYEIYMFAFSTPGLTFSGDDTERELHITLSNGVSAIHYNAFTTFYQVVSVTFPDTGSWFATDGLGNTQQIDVSNAAANANAFDVGDWAALYIYKE